jgi:hypothetical protein
MTGRRQPTLDDLVREAREAPGPKVDWEKVDAAVMARVEREARAQKAVAAYGGGARGPWIAVGGALAAAAAVTLVVASRGPARTGGPGSDVVAFEGQEHGGGSLAWKESGCAVSLAAAANGAASPATVGAALARGDAVEVRGGRAVFERAEPSLVTWGLEDGSRVNVKAARATLVLALERGAVEAQVAPVANGEAFAVDVEGARVAVHGTHLRVAREGARVVVDLREGVVSIGLPPRSGSTYGDLVTAPAHVEFDSADPHGTLKVTHEETRVRQAAPLDRPFTLTPPRTPITPALPALQPPHPAAHPSPPPHVGAPAQPAPSAAAPPPAPEPPAAAPPPPPEPSAAAAPPAVPVADPHPEKTIADAVVDCSHHAGEESRSDLVVHITSRLEVQVNADGKAVNARFNPPLPPAVQTCTSKTIYAIRYPQPGATVVVPIDFTP